MLKESSVGTLEFYRTRHGRRERRSPDFKCCRLDEYRETRISSVVDFLTTCRLRTDLHLSG
jgi:hypothetical protein